MHMRPPGESEARSGRATLAAMGTAAHRATPRGRRLAALVVAALAVVITACGEDEPMADIPQADASGMLDQLDAARAAAEAGDCPTAQAAVDEFIEMVNLLRAEDVETDVKEAMRAAGFRLEELINQQCSEGNSASAESDASGVVDTESEDPTSEETPPEETTEEEPTETEAEDDTETDEEPPEQPSGEGEVSNPPEEAEDGGDDEGTEDGSEDGGTGGGSEDEGTEDSGGGGDDSGTGGIEG
jgi:hypothetical protein